MADPKFSVLIPTRQRAGTLRYAIQSVFQQSGFDDYEVVVQDNCSSEETREVVRSLDSQRLRYHRSDTVLPMHANWEQGLSHCRGEYMFVLGDDDALMPDAMALAAPILSRSGVDVLHWPKHTYWWNDAIREDFRGMLYLNLDHSIHPIDPVAMLKGFFDWQVGFGSLPDAYSSFVHRSVIEEVISKAGAYFGPPAAGPAVCKSCAPDIYSGIANLAAGKRLAWFNRGLSIGGNSGASIGTSSVYRKEGLPVMDRHDSDEGVGPDEAYHPALIRSTNLELGVATTMLAAKERLFPSDPDCQVDLARALAAMALNINRDPGSYDEVKEEVFRFADKIGVPRAAVHVPPKGVRSPAAPQGPICTPDGRCAGLAVNCMEAGINDVAAAARLACAMLPHITVQ